MRTRIKAVSYAFPESKLTNEALSAQYQDWSVEKIESKTGIHARYIAAEDQFNLELAELAAKKLFSEHAISPDIIDCLILCTQTPKYLIPTGACVLREKLRLKKHIAAFDINLGCSGYIYSLSVAHGLISSKQAKTVLIITADTYSKLIDKDNRQLRTIFGDGAAATLLEASEEGPGIKEFCFHTDGSGFDKLISPSSGLLGLMSENPYDAHLEMNGPDIFSFTIRCVPDLVNETLQKNNLKLSDIDYCIFHQANQYMLSYLRDKIGFTEKQFIIDMADCGNTVSSSIPIALSRLYSKEAEANKKTTLLVGFGVGLSCGAMIIA